MRTLEALAATGTTPQPGAKGAAQEPDPAPDAGGRVSTHVDRPGTIAFWPRPPIGAWLMIECQEVVTCHGTSIDGGTGPHGLLRSDHRLSGDGVDRSGAPTTLAALVRTEWIGLGTTQSPVPRTCAADKFEGNPQQMARFVTGQDLPVPAREGMP